MHCFVDIENNFLKTEILNEEPRIFLLHDVLSEAKIKSVLKGSKAKKYLKKIFLRILIKVIDTIWLLSMTMESY